LGDRVTTDTTQLNADIMALELEIEGYEPGSPQELAATEELEGLQEELAAISGENAEIAGLEADIQALEERHDAAENELETAAVTEAESLAAAANKYDTADDVPDEVVAELQSLLGITEDVVQP
jgi:predicted  nucleic acid-binding Zn-ribbon protein